MFKKLTIVLIIILMICILVLIYIVLNNIRIKKIQKYNEKYITKNEETGVLEYNSDTLHIDMGS